MPTLALEHDRSSGHCWPDLASIVKSQNTLKLLWFLAALYPRTAKWLCLFGTSFPGGEQVVWLWKTNKLVPQSEPAPEQPWSTGVTVPRIKE